MSTGRGSFPFSSGWFHLEGAGRTELLRKYPGFEPAVQAVFGNYFWAPALPTVDFIGATSGAGTGASVGLPGSFASGDLVVAIGYNRSTTTLPGAPTGGTYTLITTTAANSNAGVAYYRIVDSDTTFPGFSSNCTHYAFAVYRNINSLSPIGGFSTTNDASATTINYADFSEQVADGTSCVVQLGAGRNDTIGSTLYGNLATARTQFNTEGATPAAKIAIGDIRQMTRWVGDSRATGGAANSILSITVELLASRIAANIRLGAAVDASTSAEAATPVLIAAGAAVDASTSSETAGGTVVSSGESATDASTSGESATPTLIAAGTATQAAISSETAAGTRIQPAGATVAATSGEAATAVYIAAGSAVDASVSSEMATEGLAGVIEGSATRAATSSEAAAPVIIASASATRASTSASVADGVRVAPALAVDASVSGEVAAGSCVRVASVVALAQSSEIAIASAIYLASALDSTTSSQSAVGRLAGWSPALPASELWTPAADASDIWTPAAPSASSWS